MKTLKLLVLGSVLIVGLTACPRENIIFSTDPRIVRGNWVGSAKRVAASPSQAVWSPDGTKIASNGSRTVIWDATTGARIRVIEASTIQVAWTATSVITVSGSRYLENTTKVLVRFWNSATGVLERSLDVPGDTLRVNPDGTRGVVTDAGYGQTGARVVSLQTGVTERNLNLTPPKSATLNYFDPFFWTPDGKRIVAEGKILQGDDYVGPDVMMVRVWSASTGEVEYDFLGSLVTSPISPDGKTLVYYDTGNLNVLNLETGRVRNLGTGFYGVDGWNSDSSKMYLRSARSDVTEVWNLSTLDLLHKSRALHAIQVVNPSHQIHAQPVP